MVVHDKLLAIAFLFITLGYIVCIRFFMSSVQNKINAIKLKIHCIGMNNIEYYYGDKCSNQIKSTIKYTMFDCLMFM